MLYYDDPTHKYWWQDGNEKIELNSVTNTIAKAKLPFNSHLIAGNLSKKTGRDQKEYVAEWKLKGDVACDYGNAIHKAVELHVKYKTEPKNHYLRMVIDEYKKLGYKNDKAEMMVYDLDLKIAGRMDLIDGDPNIKVNIRDIKTSWEIEKPQKKFKGVLKDLILSKLDEYTLQLSIYARILEKKGRTIGILTILEWESDKGCFRPLDVPYRPEWVELLIENY